LRESIEILSRLLNRLGLLQKARIENIQPSLRTQVVRRFSFGQKVLLGPRAVRSLGSFLTRTENPSVPQVTPLAFLSGTARVFSQIDWETLRSYIDRRKGDASNRPLSVVMFC